MERAFFPFGIAQQTKHLQRLLGLKYRPIDCRFYKQIQSLNYDVVSTYKSTFTYSEHTLCFLNSQLLLIPVIMFRMRNE